MNEIFQQNPIFCCPGFQHSIENAGKRGIAALVQRTSNGIMFLQQSRGIAFEDESKIRPAPEGPDIKINVSAESGLQYCPFCGTQLQKLVAKSPEAFEELALKHKQFFKSLF